MLDQKTRDSLTYSELVSHHLRRLALLVDPASGHLSALAETINVHPTTLSTWIAQGYVPLFQVAKLQKLQKNFDNKPIPTDELCAEQFRSR